MLWNLHGKVSLLAWMSGLCVAGVALREKAQEAHKAVHYFARISDEVEIFLTRYNADFLILGNLPFRSRIYTI